MTNNKTEIITKQDGVFGKALTMVDVKDHPNDLQIPWRSCEDDASFSGELQNIWHEIMKSGASCSLPEMENTDIWSKSPQTGWNRRNKSGEILSYDLVLSRFRDGNNSRFIVHLQSPRPIKKAALEHVRECIAKQYGRGLIAEVERIREVLPLGKGKRKVSSDVPWGIGSPISVSTGPAGTLTALLWRKGGKEEGATYALTAAHILKDGNGAQSQFGDPVYFPPVTEAAPTFEHQHVASVETIRWRAFAAWDVLAVGGENVTYPRMDDYAILRLEQKHQRPGDLPDGGSLKGTFLFKGENPLPRNTVLTKVSAATPTTKGWVQGVDAGVIFRSDEGVVVAASGLIEIAGDGGSFSSNGDSGALVYNKNREAVGYIIAGSLSGKLPGGQYATSFIMPLQHTLATIEMELAL